MTTYTDPKEYWAAVNKWNSYQGNTNWTNPHAGQGSYPVLAAQPKAATPAAAATTAAATTTAASTEPTAEEKRKKAIEDAVTKGGTYLSAQLADMGLNAQDAADITARYNTSVGEVGGNIPADSTNINSYYNYGDLLNKAVTGETNQQQNTLQQAFQQSTPYGWQQGIFADTADDPILSELLGQQAGTLSDTLKRKLERGQMSQSAYDYAMSQLGYDPTGANNTGMAAAANSQLQGIGGGVLSGYRTGLGDIATDYNNQITNFELGDILSQDVYNQNISNKTAEYNNRMRGDITGALGNTQLFDLNTLVAKAGSSAGPGNTPIAGGNPGGSGAILEEDPNQRNVGTSGTF